MDCENTITHVIKRGDTIYRLAKTYGTTVPEIMMNNQGINPYNLQVGTSLVICRKRSGENPGMGNQGTGNMELNQSLRNLWEQLSYWIRMYIVSVSNNTPDKEEIITRLKEIPARMGDAFSAYYPTEVAERLRESLEQLVERIIRLASLVKDGDASQTDRVDTQLEQDVSDLAEILSNMNINYDRQELANALGEYLLLTKREIVAQLSGEYADDIATFDEVERQGLRLADYLARGIANQRNAPMR